MLEVTWKLIYRGKTVVSYEPMPREYVASSLAALRLFCLWKRLISDHAHSAFCVQGAGEMVCISSDLQRICSVRHLDILQQIYQAQLIY